MNIAIDGEYCNGCELLNLEGVEGYYYCNDYQVPLDNLGENILKNYKCLYMQKEAVND